MLVFVSTFFNHHQRPLAKELYSLLKEDYWFIELEQMSDTFINAGYPVYDNAPFMIQSWKSDKNKKRATELILNADVVVYDQIDSISSLKYRLDKEKLTFECSERWLKKGLLNLLSPRLIKSQLLYHTYLYNKPLYRLCSSAYAASDFAFMHSYKNKCFKWGYFTEIQEVDIMDIVTKKNSSSRVRFISVGRLIDWKRHDLTIKAAKILKDKGLDFEINIFGSGPEKTKLEKLILNLNLENNVFLRGNKDNRLLLDEFRKHHACVFPSNRQEGWGAVVNEAMSNACPVIGSDKAGAVPYLIENNSNGLIFTSGDLYDLADRMKYIIESPEILESLSAEAYHTMSENWSPKCAAKNLLTLIEAIQLNKSFPDKGPCSIA